MQDKMNDSILNQQHGPKGSQQIPTPPPSVSGGKRLSLKPARQYAQLSEPETRVAVELLFAVINEMYTLSSAWNIRRTLLTAAKSFLLRPGNPSLLTVQSLIQKSVIDANTSDAGLAHQLRKIRENGGREGEAPSQGSSSAHPERPASCADGRDGSGCDRRGTRPSV